MDKGWEVSEEKYLEHLMTNVMVQTDQEVKKFIDLKMVHEVKEVKDSKLSTQTYQEQSPKKSQMRFRTSSMPKLAEEVQEAPQKSETAKKLVRPKPVIIEEQIPFCHISNNRNPQKRNKFMPFSQQKISLKTTLFQNPLEDSQSKFGRTLVPKQFNPLQNIQKEQHFQGLKGQTRSVKSASMSNIFNDERINYKRRIDDFVFKLRPQRNTNIINILSDESLYRRYKF
ncbi:hypothetical protein pb186bvf_020058 [Paramecium bursaria]